MPAASITSASPADIFDPTAMILPASISMSPFWMSPSAWSHVMTHPPVINVRLGKTCLLAKLNGGPAVEFISIGHCLDVSAKQPAGLFQFHRQLPGHRGSLRARRVRQTVCRNQDSNTAYETRR